MLTAWQSIAVVLTMPVWRTDKWTTGRQKNPNSLLNSHQSAYCKHHSTETVLFVHPRSPRQCNRITENIMSLSTRPLCCFRHHWPWHLDHPSLILECLFILSIWCWWACGGDDNLRNQKVNGLNYTLSGCYGPERHARHWRITNLNWPICI